MTRTNGFTLIELLVVISIIALLSSVVMTSLNAARAKARDASRAVVAGQIFRALQAYHSDTGSYPSSGGTASIVCLGRATGESCQTGTVNHPGLTSLKTVFDPYMAVPLDPNPTRGGAPSVAQGYLYSSTCHQNWVGSALPVNANKPCLMWFPETTPSAASCRPAVLGYSASTLCGTYCDFCSHIVNN